MPLPRFLSLLADASAITMLVAAMSSSALAAEAVQQRRASAPGAPYHEREDVRAFIAEMSAEHAFASVDLERWFAAARHQPRVIELMTRPVVEPPRWFEYAPPFLARARVEAGIAFWSTHDEALQRARVATGIPPEIIVAIIGIETYYGRYVGSHRVLDALATLAFDYPRRAPYFRGELREFLLLAREQGISPLSPKGSYAGAMGIPQFMPGSYRRYAVDFDNSGSVDLLGSVDDAIGSVANYLARHDWQRGQPVLLPARLAPERHAAILGRLEGGLSDRRVAPLWAEDGVTVVASPGTVARDPFGLLLLEESASESSYWIACHNFYVITRYNRSRLYATAVLRLAEALRAARGSS